MANRKSEGTADKMAEPCTEDDCGPNTKSSRRSSIVRLG